MHEGKDCKQYQKDLLLNAMDDESRATKLWMDVSLWNRNYTKNIFLFIQDLIEKGEALNCPSCQVLLLKKWGCDWVRCTYCRTEICWVTKQLRWGPAVQLSSNIFCKLRGKYFCRVAATRAEGVNVWLMVALNVINSATIATEEKERGKENRLKYFRIDSSVISNMKWY